MGIESYVSHRKNEHRGERADRDARVVPSSDARTDEREKKNGARGRLDKSTRALNPVAWRAAGARARHRMRASASGWAVIVATRASRLADCTNTESKCAAGAHPGHRARARVTRQIADAVGATRRDDALSRKRALCR